MTNNFNENNKFSVTSSIPDHSVHLTDKTCIVYKFQSRPPYEGFILILTIIVIIVLLLWWLNSKL